MGNVITKQPDEYYVERAKAAYYAYGGVTDHKNYQGLPMPEWDQLTDKIRSAWVASVHSVYDYLHVTWEAETPVDYTIMVGGKPDSIPVETIASEEYKTQLEIDRLDELRMKTMWDKDRFKRNQPVSDQDRWQEAKECVCPTCQEAKAKRESDYPDHK